MLECADGTLYTGITTDLERRLAQHNGERPGGARCTRARRPVRLAYAEPQSDRGAAARREAEIKRLRVGDKRALVAGWDGEV
ncbi:GIY-YIG nuclease family protein [Acidihalobacter prosperus]